MLDLLQLPLSVEEGITAVLSRASISDCSTEDCISEARAQRAIRSDWLAGRSLLLLVRFASRRDNRSGALTFVGINYKLSNALN